MNIKDRKDLLVRLGEYMSGSDEEWQATKTQASVENQWFTPEFIDLAINNIIHNYLQPSQLQFLIDEYDLHDNDNPRSIGLVLAGNIPLVGFHDLLSVFITGHYTMVKPSSKDEVLVKHIIQKMVELDPAAKKYFNVRDLLKGAYAFIATGSNNSSRYFEYYFRNHPHIIRKNRTSVAVLTGKESAEELEKLADDVHQYFGLGCRNVTKIYVPEHYEFEPLLDVFKKYHYLIDHNKYKNNYDYNLAIHMLNKKYYMTNGSILLVKDESPFSPISQLNYSFYTNGEQVKNELDKNEAIQCVVSKQDVNFGEAQTPGICDFADGVDTIEFLRNIH